MMRAQYFVYTRNYGNDYKSIIVPSEDFCPKEVRKFFLNQARGLINVEQYDDPLDNPRWLFSRKDSLILFGLGTNNNALNEECYKDYAGRPVRGFFGVIIDSLTEDVKIPYDINFYKDLYTNHILPIWNQDREQFVGHIIELDVDVNAYHCIEKNENSTQLNFDSRKSVILGDVGIEECISNALFFPGDTSVAIGFSDKNHAFAAEYAYLNAIVEGVEIREEKMYKIKDESKIQINNVKADKEDVERKKEKEVLSKKALRPKAILTYLAILLLCLMLILILQKPKTDPSGEKQQEKIQTILDSLNLDSIGQKRIRS